MVVRNYEVPEAIKNSKFKSQKAKGKTETSMA